MNTKYLCGRWQGLLEQLVNLIGHGYFYYHITVIPSDKIKDNKRLEKLDQKMISKYKLDNESRNTFRYRKLKGLANFRYLRWENVLIVLRTEGIIITEDNQGEHSEAFNQKQIEKYIISDVDKFSDIRQSPMEISVGEQVSFNLQLLPKKDAGEKVTVKFTKQMFKDKKAEFDEYISLRHTSRVIDCFKRLNSIPAWRGIIIQKRELKKFILEQAKKHGVKINSKELYLEASRKKEDIIFIK